VLPFFIAYAKIILGNGGAWQTKIQETGNASASKTEKHTDVTMENETLNTNLITLHSLSSRVTCVKITIHASATAQTGLSRYRARH
jgi:hypothetical protein